jgi:hypothetical protein
MMSVRHAISIGLERPAFGKWNGFGEGKPIQLNAGQPPSLAFHFPWVTGFGSHTPVIWLQENWGPNGFQNLCMISVALIRGSGSDDSEYNHLKNQIESEQFHPSSEGGLPRFFRDLPKDEQQAKLKDRLKKYCQKVFFFHPSCLCNSRPPFLSLGWHIGLNFVCTVSWLHFIVMLSSNHCCEDFSVNVFITMVFIPRTESQVTTGIQACAG